MIALLRMSGGLIVWAVAFCILYGLHGIGCAGGWTEETVAGLGLHRAVLLTAWVACMVAGAALAATLRPRTRGFVDLAAWRVALVGLVATAVTGLPILTLPSCL